MKLALSLLSSALLISTAAPSMADPLWVTTFSGTDENTRTLINTNVAPFFTDQLTATFNNLTFSDTTFTGTPFKLIEGTHRDYFSPNTNVDLPTAASPQNGGSWQSDFRYGNGSQSVTLSSVVLATFASNSSGALQNSSATLRDVQLTLEYSVNNGTSWATVGEPIVFDATGPATINRTYAFATPVTLDLGDVDFWLRVKAENTGGTAGSYVNLASITVNTVPEPGTWILLIMGGAIVLWRKKRTTVVPHNAKWN